MDLATFRGIGRRCRKKLRIIRSFAMIMKEFFG